MPARRTASATTFAAEFGGRKRRESAHEFSDGRANGAQDHGSFHGGYSFRFPRPESQVYAPRQMRSILRADRGGKRQLGINEKVFACCSPAVKSAKIVLRKFHRMKTKDNSERKSGATTGLSAGSNAALNAEPARGGGARRRSPAGGGGRRHRQDARDHRAHPQSCSKRIPSSPAKTSWGLRSPIKPPGR